MIEIFGPSYRYNNEILTNPEIIFVNDHHYDDDDHCFHVKTLLENSVCDPQQHLLVFDHMGHQDQLQAYNHVSLPIFLAASCAEFAQQKIIPNWANKTHIFNFMINKPRPNREFLLLLIEHFKLSNYSYSLCWKKLEVNRGKMMINTQSALYQTIIQNTPMNIDEKSYTFGQEVFLDYGLRYGRAKNSENYAGLLQTTVFEPSCVSLITEPSFYERETLKTEKTIMAIYGGTLPIWAGGWGIPESMRRLGFDVFDDIVDHSYEHMTDPWDRAYYAVEKNIKLLSDPDLAKDFVAANHARLQHNVDLVEQNVFLKYCSQKIDNYDQSTKSVLIKILQERNSHNIQHVDLDNGQSRSIKITQKLF